MATNRASNLTIATGPSWDADTGGTLALSALAAAMLAVARSESSERRWIWVALFLAATIPPWLLSRWLRHRQETRRTVESFAAILVAAWGAIPVPIAFVLRRVGMGEAVELTMISMLQNAGLMASALARDRAWLQASQLAAGFTALFALMAGGSLPLFALGGCFGLGLLWSLMAAYWERVRRPRAALAMDRCLPARSVVVAATAMTAAMVAALAFVVGGGGNAAMSLRGFLPTSGGEGGGDEFARAGVGDGDALVEAQDDAKGVGPVESELFLESDMPTLYDMANDLYGHAAKPKEKSERSIALESGKVKLTHERTAQNKDGGGREFSAVRRAPRQPPRQQSDQDSPAMLFVKGAVPAHLALERYDRFDGRVWMGSGGDIQESAAISRSRKNPAIRLESVEGKPWLRIADSIHSIFRGESSWTVKVINLRTNRVAAPPYPAALHIDRLDQPDFLGWTEDGSLALAGRSHIPQLTVLHLRARRFHLAPLHDQDWRSPEARTPDSRTPASRTPKARTTESHVVARPDNTVHSADNTMHSAGDTVRGSLAARLAREWTSRVPAGWRQVEAVSERLRDSYQLDWAARVPDDAGDAVEHFLRAGRGPDYLFASACATMLRELGYRTRLATGFYARPERLNPQSGFTAVQADDVHVWVEVSIGGPHWVAVEPTPGYEPPAETLTLWEWVTRRTGQFGERVAAHSKAIVGVAVLLAIAVAARNWLADVVVAGVLAVLARWADGGRSRRAVLYALRLLEWRARRAGFRRPAHVTLSSWYGRLRPVLAPDAGGAVAGLLAMAERCLYAVPDATPGHGAGRFPDSSGQGMTTAVPAAPSCRLLPSIATLRRAFRDTTTPAGNRERRR